MIRAAAPPMRSFFLAVLSVAAASTLLTLVGVYMSRSSRVDGALFGLPSSERSALYSRTLETLRTTCAHATEGDLFDYCQQQARLIARFPECEGDCQLVSRQFLPRPTK
ncbi:MAG: hypothetical protein QM784_30560 [Polyangiaceae bacterium]